MAARPSRRDRWSRRASRASVVVLVLVVCFAGAATAAAPPPPPAAYYGTLTVNGDPAPAGVTVTAHIDGEERGRLVTAAPGWFGGPSAFDEKLQVDGQDGDDGRSVEFVVGGVRADATVAWQAGDVRRVDLAVTGDVDLPEDGDSSGGSTGSSGGGSTGSSGSSTGSESGGSAANETAESDRGASVTVDRTTNVTRVAVTNATANATVSVELTAEEADTVGNVSLDGLDITTTGGDFTLSVTQHDDPPADAAGTPPGGAVGYVQIDHSVPDDRIEEVVFRFRVSTSRLAERGLDPADVVLYRLHDGVWTALETTSTADTGTHHTFRAVSPGLSVFAIGSQRGPETPSASNSDTPTADPPGDASGGGELAAPNPTEQPTAAVPAGPSPPALGPLLLGLGVLLVALLGVRHWLRRG